MRRIPLAALTLLGLVALASAGHAEERARVIAIQTHVAEPYGAAFDGLSEVVGPRADLRVERVDHRDPKEAERIRALNPDLIVPIGSQATSWALAHTENVPIVFMMVLNPVSSGLVPSMQSPGARITGASLDIPSSVQLRTLKDLVKARRIAVLFNRERTGKVVAEARKAAKRQGIDLIPIHVTSPKKLNEALEQVDRTFDALWSVADQTVLAHGAGERILVHAIRHGIPFMGLSETYVRAGALLALVSSYKDNGRQAGALVLRVLRGESPSKIPVSVPDKLEVVFNPLTAKRLNLKLSSNAKLKLRSVR